MPLKKRRSKNFSSGERVNTRKKSEKRKKYIDSSQENNSDTCYLCDCFGNLVCCDRCPNSYHITCLDKKYLPKNIESVESWFCPFCQNKLPSKGDSIKSSSSADGEAMLYNNNYNTPEAPQNFFLIPLPDSLPATFDEVTETTLNTPGLIKETASTVLNTSFLISSGGTCLAASSSSASSSKKSVCGPKSALTSFLEERGISAQEIRRRCFALFTMYYSYFCAYIYY
jgi:hypothetical protein